MINSWIIINGNGAGLLHQLISTMLIKTTAPVGYVVGSRSTVVGLAVSTITDRLTWDQTTITDSRGVNSGEESSVDL